MGAKWIAGLAAGSLLAAVPAWADTHDDHHDQHRAAPQAHNWRSGDIRHFADRDQRDWQGGHWKQGNHDGRNGWFWVVGDTWFPYDSPTAGAPNPYTPSGVAAAPGGQQYYYCASMRQYYPYVTFCPEGWQPAPAPAP